MRRAILALLVAFMMIAIGVGVGRLVVTGAGPAISGTEAAKLALQKEVQEYPQLTGLMVVRSQYEPSPQTVRDSRGRVRFSQSRSGSPS